jgi:hypothetical protein
MGRGVTVGVLCCVLCRAVLLAGTPRQTASALRSLEAAAAYQPDFGLGFSSSN